MRKISTILLFFGIGISGAYAQADPIQVTNVNSLNPVNAITSTPGATQLTQDDQYGGIGVGVNPATTGCAMAVTNYTFSSAALAQMGIVMGIGNVVPSTTLGTGTTQFDLVCARIDNTTQNNALALDLSVDQNGLVGVGLAASIGFNSNTNAHLYITDPNVDGYPLIAAYTSYGQVTNANLPAFVVTSLGNVGIGTLTPSQALQVLGTTTTTNFQMTSGAASGYILTSDASGNASWQSAASASDNIYDADGSLTANRTMTMGTDNLNFNENNGTLQLNSTQCLAEIFNAAANTSPATAGSSPFAFAVVRAQAPFSPLTPNALDLGVDANGMVAVGAPAADFNNVFTTSAYAGTRLGVTDPNLSGTTPLFTVATNTNNPTGLHLAALTVDYKGYTSLGGYLPDGINPAHLYLTDPNSSGTDPLMDVVTNQSATAMYIDHSGNVGIGNAAPAYMLDVTGTANIYSTLNVGAGNSSGASEQINNGGQALRLVNSTGYTGWANQIVFEDGSGNIRDLIYDDYSSGSTQGDLVIQPGYYGHGSGVLNINGIVQVGNVTTPDALTTGGYSMYVQYGILAERFKCALNGTSDWSDFVFDKGYKLPDLSEVESYINTNHHLPDVPSAEDVVCDGIDMAKMDSKLLQKIEELTLYVLDLKKENTEMKAEIANLKK